MLTMTAVPPVSGFEGVSPVGGAASTAGPESATAKGEFAKLFNRTVGQANEQMVRADQSINQLATGKSDDLQDVVLSMAKADLSFRFILEMRNQLMEAYQEIMRMQV